MATSADIIIAVKGIQKLKEARAEINQLNRAINKSNKEIVKAAKEKGVVDKARLCEGASAGARA